MRQLSEALDVKMVQRDSLGHIASHAAEIGGHFKMVSSYGCFGFVVSWFYLFEELHESFQAVVHYTQLGTFFDMADREVR